MKATVILLLAVLIGFHASGAEETGSPLTTLTTLGGRTFDGVKVLKHDPDGLVFRHSLGLAKISFSDLPTSVHERFGYRAEAAAAFVKEHVEAGRVAREKAVAARHQARVRKAEQKAMRSQLELMRWQMAAAVAGGEWPGFVDGGVPFWGGGYGGGEGVPGMGRPFFGSDRDRLFHDYPVTRYVGPDAPLYNGAVTTSSVRPFLTFGGYDYPVDLAVRRGPWPNSQGFGVRPPLLGSGPARPFPLSPLVPANSGGNRIGGTGTLMQTSSNRITHQ
jgi:hypothetical protein